MAFSWVRVPNPTVVVTGTDSLRQLSDGANLVIYTNGTTADTQLQVYSTNDTWGPVLTIPVGSLGAHFLMGLMSPLQGGQALIVNAVPNDDSVPDFGSLNVSTGAITPGAHPSRGLTTPFASGTWGATGGAVWFETMPTLYGVTYSTVLGTEYLIVMFNIETAALAGIILANVNTAAGEAGFLQLGLSNDFPQYQNVPQGGIYGQASFDTITDTYGDIATLVPANAFVGAATTSITWAGDGATVTGVPALNMTAFNSGGFLTPTTLDTFNETLVTDTIAAIDAGIGGAGASSFASFSGASGFPITMQPFDLSAETFGVPVTLPAPETPTDFIVLTGFNGTAYTLINTVDTNFFKMENGSPPTGNATISDTFLAPTAGFVDMTVASNRRKFISTAGGAQNLGSDGSSVFGVTPQLFLTSDGTPSSFAINRGRGGAFAITGGTLSDGASDPPASFETLSTTKPWSPGSGVLGDYLTGNLYAFNPATFTDNGTQKRWVRRWRGLPQADSKAKKFAYLWINMETGKGVPPGVSPNLVLRWSDDGGHSWSNQRILSIGPLGATAFRVKFNRLGMTGRFAGTDRIFELSSSDPFALAIIDAMVEVSA
jgi:hypothetical protein